MPKPATDQGSDFMATMEQFAEAILEWAREETRETEHSDAPRQGAPGEDNGGVRADGTVAADRPVPDPTVQRDRRLAQDPLTEKGERILNEMKKNYGSEKKAKEVFYASKNAGKISGVDQDAEDAVVYHGTRAEALQSILDNGLMATPNMHYHPDRFYEGERGDSVYVAIDPVEAARWALEEVADPGDATVLEIEVPQDSLVPDEQWSKAERHVGDIPPDAIMKAYLVNADGSASAAVACRPEARRDRPAGSAAPAPRRDRSPVPPASKPGCPALPARRPVATARARAGVSGPRARSCLHCRACGICPVTRNPAIAGPAGRSGAAPAAPMARSRNRGSTARLAARQAPAPAGRRSKAR